MIIINNKEEFKKEYHYTDGPKEYPSKYPFILIKIFVMGGLGGDYVSHKIFYPPEGVDIETFFLCLNHVKFENYLEQ